MPLHSLGGMERVSLKDVARALGVNASTVSRALAAHPRIPRETRERVRARAEAMGYRPDPVAASAAAKRWRGRAEAGARLAYVSLGGPVNRREPQFAGAREAAVRLGYRLELFAAGDARAAARLEGVLRARGIRGVVFRHAGARGRLPAWDWRDFAAVVLGEPPDGDRAFDYVCSAVTESHERAFAEVVARGWRRPGVCLLETPWLASERRRVGGLAAAALAAGRPVPPVFWLGAETSARALAEWVRAERLDGVLGQMPIVRERLAAAGIRLATSAQSALKAGSGRGTRRAGTGNGRGKGDGDGEIDFVVLQLAPGEAPELAGVEVDFVEIGRATVRHADMLLRQNRLGLPERPTVTLVTARWREAL